MFLKRSNSEGFEYPDSAKYGGGFSLLAGSRSKAAMVGAVGDPRICCLASMLVDLCICVTEGRHHARCHVIKVVTMKRPLARIGPVYRNGDLFHRWKQNRVAHGAGKTRLIANPDNLETMSMQMNGVRHHRLVLDLEFDPISF